MPEHGRMDERGTGKLPVVEGWTAYLDDTGPTLTADRQRRLRNARLSGFAAAALWIGAALVGAAAVRERARRDPLARSDPVPQVYESLPVALVMFAFAAGLTVVCFWFGRTQPRWTAVPGAVVRRMNPGGEIVFTAVRLVLQDDWETDSQSGSTLYRELRAYDADGVAFPVFKFTGDGEELADAGRWLAGHAEIPFADLRNARTQG
jgi:hypothetical protein